MHQDDIKITHRGLSKQRSNGSEDMQKITHAGLVARSPEGTAAKAMNIRGNEDMWVEIQAHTFRNWVNEHLRAENTQVNNWATDFCDGTKLCMLVEILQNCPLKMSWKRRPLNQHHFLENVTAALSAIEADHVKLVNIGNVDIVNGNVKLILGLIWSLIVRYQIGRSKFPPRKLMLAWLQAVLPDCRVTNLTTDWNSGINLAALLDYCEPGLFPNWRTLDPDRAVSNCTHAMNVAQKEFGVPKVLEPEYLASPWLDELSGMTYLSYFMKPGGPGYNATMRWVNSQVEERVKNFTTDWNDGRVFHEIIKNKGGPVGKFSHDPSNYESNIRNAVEAGFKLGVEPILSPKEMANSEVEHLGIMAYAARLQNAKPRPSLASFINILMESTSGRVGEPVHFRVELLSQEIDLNQLKAYVEPPTGRPIPVRIDSLGDGVFIPENYGMHEITLTIEDETIGGHYFRVLPRLLQVIPPNMAPCALGSVVEVLVNATGAPKTEDISVIATSPTGIEHNCPLRKIDEGHSAKFKPDEAGLWTVAIMYQGRHIQNGPFTCSVFDLSGVTVHGLDGAVANRAHTFDIDARGVGVSGELHVDIVHEKKSLACAVDRIKENEYRVTFLPHKNGKYRVYVYFNSFDVKGSPYILRIGKKSRSGKTQAHNTQSKKTTQQIYSSSTDNHGKDYEEKTYNTYGSHNKTKDLDEKIYSTNIYGTHSKHQDLEEKTYNTYGSHNKTKDLDEKIYSTNIYGTQSKHQDLEEKTYNTYGSHNKTKDLDEKIYSTNIYGTQNKNKDLDLDEKTYTHSTFGKHYISGSPTTFDDIYEQKHHSSYTREKKEEYTTDSSSRLNTTLNKKSYFDAPKNSSSNIIISSKTRGSPGLGDGWDSIERKNHHFSSESRDTVERKTTTDYMPKHNLDRKQYLEFQKDISYSEVRNNSRNGERIIETSSYLNDRGNRKVSEALIKVDKIPNGVVGKPVEFKIDGSKAGSGNLEILVNGGRVTSSVRSLGGQRFIASFIPHEEGVHTIEITFNGETLMGSPWHVDIMSVKKVSMLGESTRLIPSNTPAVFEILPPPGQNLINGKCVAKVLTPNKKELNANVTHKAENGALRIEFVPTEVGTHIIEASIDGVSISGGPLIAKVYDIRQIKVIDVRNGVINEPCQFRVDASAAGEGQLEISINEGEVPNHVQVVSGGRCLVSFTPEQAKPHLIDIKFNGETVEGCPFICNVADTSCVIFNLSNLELIPVNQPASFHITMNGGGAAELAVSVCSPKGELPVRVTGDINTGFIAEFTPTCVGGHSINVEYNGSPVQGTPFLAKAYDASKVVVGKLSNQMVGQPSQFTVDASDAGEGNLEITIASRGQNIPTQVQPQGGARFTVTFVPTAACEHTIHVSFNKISVPGCPKTFNISGMEPGPQVTFTGPGPIHEPNYFVITHGGGRLEDIEVNVEGPAGQSVPAQVHQTADGIFTAEFMPRVVGEHQVHVTINGVPTAGSPYAAKVYDVNAIKVKNVPYGCVNRAVSFLVETSHAGPGNLEVTVNGGRVPTSAQAQGPHVYAISFTPREAQTHTVELKFNGQNVPGSPFVCNISAAARIQPLQPIDKINVGHLFDFIVESDSKPIVEVVGPTRKNIAVQVEPAVASQGYKVAFTPYEVGDHSVEVRMPGGEHVDGSPFLLKVYSVEKVLVTDIQPGVVGKSVSFGINASQAGAGNLEIIVAVNGRNVPNFVQSEGNAHFKVNFKPTEAAMHSLSVRFNGHAVPGSPFMCMISAPNDSVHQATASGDGLKQALVNSENIFYLKGFGKLMPQVLITSPCGDQVGSQISERDGAFEASFRPTVIGRHLISVTCNNQHINGSPYSCNVFDVSRVVVQGLDEKLGPVLLNAPVMFRVDAAGSGEGTLELVVSTETATVKAEVVACSRGLYEVTFVPKTVELHFVNITFNDLPVNNSPFTVAVQPSSQMLPVGSLARIEFPAKGLMAETFSPDNKPVLHQCVGNFLQFQTDKVGSYAARFYGESNNYVTSRILNIFDASLVKIIEVSEAFCYRPASVSISTYEAGEGELSVTVRCAGNKVRHSIRESNKNGVFEIVYHPTFVAPIKMTIYFNGVPISAKPLKINVLQANTGDDINLSGLGLLQAQVGKTTTFTIDTAKKSAKEFDVVVSGPEGEAFPVRCYQTKSGHLQAEYSINKPGKCHIEVLHQAVPLTGSPFICEAFDNNRVTVEGIPSGLIPLYSPVMLTVHTSEAGNAELEAFCIAPNKKNVAVEVMKIRSGTYGVELTPYLSGQFKLDLTYGGEHVPASPITLNVSTSTKTDDKMLESDCLVCQPGRETSFIINCPNSPVAEIKRLHEIGEQIVPKVKPLNNNKWVVTFTLLSVGHYEIHGSSRNGSSIVGSPWKVLCVEASKVTPVGGWSSLLDKEGRLMLPAQIIFNVAEAGPGKLFCKVDSNEVKIENLGENQLCVYISAENLSPGEHDLNLTWSGQLIENCPRSGYVNPQHYANQVVLSGRGLEVAQIGETAHFKIDATAAPAGRPEVILVYQDNSTLPVGITQPRPNENIWLASYTPQKMLSDSLSLSVKWNGQLVKGCPLHVSLGLRTDAAKVVCSGEGLRHGILERDIKSWIDTRRAGPGELTAHCVGPRKVAFCELYEHGDATFTLNVKPQEPGPHLLTIKYGGQNVPGSPFSLKVAGKPDASKVRVHGPGIEHGVLATFQSRFTCDTRGAGAGQLTVRVRGPKGAFRVEMQRESQKDRTILCKYDPTEPGDYRVEVKWAGEFVPGSPFPVMIFDTEEELQRYLQAIEIQ